MEIVKLLFQTCLILFYFIYAIIIYSKDTFYPYVFGISALLGIPLLWYGYFKGFPFFICLTKGDILKYLDNLDKKGENDKIYLIYINNEKRFLASFKSYFLMYITIICLLLTFTDKLGFSINKFSKININNIFQYRFIFISNFHFWFSVIMFVFYYYLFVFIRRRNISKVFFKYFDLKNFKRNSLIESRLLNMNFRYRGKHFKYYFFILRNIRNEKFKRYRRKMKRYVPKHIIKNKQSHKQ
ncbi:hypothetical protein LNP09_01550 [Apilactobacillus kunkeei]|uniref:hypothetical protein n=1 Tax=Apilactobacillus kunkeei TaxID=148814 RepID=UPI00200ACA69|nr:hypothetical protein [Apilactobacillus kunkeei]MCK8619656.1 hypothetical protein [Apilactobacillus kunkeei]